MKKKDVFIASLATLIIFGVLIFIILLNHKNIRTKTSFQGNNNSNEIKKPDSKKIAQDATIDENTTQEDDSFHLQTETCNGDNCLFTSSSSPYSLGVVTVKGYYKKSKIKAYPIDCESEDVKNGTSGCVAYYSECDQFVITEKNNPFKDNTGIDNSNSINLYIADNTNDKELNKSLADENKLLFGSELSSISKEEKNILLKSKQDNEIKITLLKLNPLKGISTGPCYSNFSILRVR